MRGALLLALALPLSGCRGEEEQPANEVEAARSIENIATAAPAKEPDYRPVVASLSAAEVGALPPGPRCVFSVGEHLAFVAVPGDALAKVNGRLVRFTTAGPLGPTGGYFVGEGYTLSVGRTKNGGKMAVSDHSRTERPVREHRGSWRCGA